MSVTLLITAPVVAWPRELPPGEEVFLFHLHEGAWMLELPPLPHRVVEHVYCHASRQHLPAPAGSARPGGLANLAAMIRASGITLSCPRGHWPLRVAPPGPKEVAILLPEDAGHPLTVEGLRLATGLVACRHRVVLYHGDGSGAVVSAAAPYGEALGSFGAVWRSWSEVGHVREHDVVLAL